MRLFTILFCLLIFIGTANAVSLTCDVPLSGPIPTVYKLTGPAWIPTSVPAKSTGEILLDVSSALVGTNSITVAACITDPIWGEACSAAIPFDFTRPLPPAIIKAIRLIP